MDKLTGIEATKVIRQRAKSQHLRHLPIIGVTSLVGDNQVRNLTSDLIPSSSASEEQQQMQHRHQFYLWRLCVMVQFAAAFWQRAPSSGGISQRVAAVGKILCFLALCSWFLLLVAWKRDRGNDSFFSSEGVSISFQNGFYDENSFSSRLAIVWSYCTNNNLFYADGRGGRAVTIWNG